MKKILLIALAVVQSDIQAMSLKNKISKMFSKHDYILTTVVRETKEEEREFINAKRRPRKSSLPIPIENSSISVNKDESYSSSFIIVDSNYMLNVQRGKVFFHDVFAQSSQNFNITDKDEYIFDMEPDTERLTQASSVSNYTEQSPGYTLSEGYFPSIYREKHLYDIQESRHGTSHNPRERRKSSIEMYYDKSEADKKKHSIEVPTNSNEGTINAYKLRFDVHVHQKVRQKRQAELENEKSINS